MAKRPRPKELYPLPVHALFNDPRWVALPAAGRGILISICEHFWRSGCAAIPTDADQLFAIGRAHRPTWRTHKPAILAIFETVRPDLERYLARREAGARGMDVIQMLGSSAAQRKASATRYAKAQPPSQTILDAIPTLEPGRRAQPKTPAPAPTNTRSRLRA